MYNNYLYLRRLVKELNKILNDFYLIRVYSQEKNKLLLHFSNDNNETIFLVFSIDPQLSYLTIKKEHTPAKKNISFFFKKTLPSKLLNIELSINDRIIKFNFITGELFLIIHGNLSNAVFQVENFVEFYKTGKMEKSDKLIKYLNDISYKKDFSSSSTFNNKLLDLDFKEIKKQYPFFTKELYAELLYRLDNSNKKDSLYHLNLISNEILKEKIAVFYNDSLSDISFLPITFSSFNIPSNSLVFTSYFEAVDNLIFTYFNLKNLFDEKRKLTEYINKEIEKTFNKLNNISLQLQDENKSEKYRRNAELLLLNRNKLFKGMEVVTIETGNECQTIKMNKKKSPQENIDDYFQKAKDFRTEFEQYHKLYKLTLDKYNKLKEIKENVQNISNIKEMKNLKNDIGISDKKNENKSLPTSQIKYRKFIYSENYTIYVGKDNKNNDLLTFRLAKQNDYWFHARGVAGSHVVLKAERQKGNIPKYVLEKAASIAAFFSKAKNASLSPVSYTLRKYVQKRKGLEPGQVVLIQENTLIVKPQIPEDCIEDKEVSA
ncbi:MAG: DUF814 domain-containing protein [Ignavibacteriales bacterium]|nr:DUF814 domain-containing protein [Ignavibacteriales bacterium]